MIKRVLSWLLRDSEKELRSTVKIIYCEHCHNKLVLVDGELQCSRCGLSYGKVLVS